MPQSEFFLNIKKKFLTPILLGSTLLLMDITEDMYPLVQKEQIGWNRVKQRPALPQAT